MESREHLTAIELQLLTLDQDPGNAEAMNAIFRGFHTIKGWRGFWIWTRCATWRMKWRRCSIWRATGSSPSTPRIIDRILESKDYLNVWMTELEEMLRSGKTPVGPEASGLLEAIRGLVTGLGTSLPTGPPAIPAAIMEAPRAVEPATPGLMELAREVAAPQALEGSTETAPAEVVEAAKAAEARPSGARSIKVETAKLDYLVDMVGEMVIAQSLVRHDPDLAAGLKPRLARNLSQLARITDEVQRIAMSMRMIPVGSCSRRSRLVRDLSRKAGKQVELELRARKPSWTATSSRSWPIR